MLYYIYMLYYIHAILYSFICYAIYMLCYIQKEVRARMKRRQRETEDNEEVENILEMEENAKDQAILDEPDLAKPEPPRKFDEKLVKLEIEEKFKRIKRRPGEPILTTEISYSTNVTSLRDCPM